MAKLQAVIPEEINSWLEAEGAVIGLTRADAAKIILMQAKRLGLSVVPPQAPSPMIHAPAMAQHHLTTIISPATAPAEAPAVAPVTVDPQFDPKGPVVNLANGTDPNKFSPRVVVSKDAPSYTPGFDLKPVELRNKRPWFALQDVCTLLDVDPSLVKGMLDPNEDIVVIGEAECIDALGVKSCINEAMVANEAKAKDFEKWAKINRII